MDVDPRIKLKGWIVIRINKKDDRNLHTIVLWNGVDSYYGYDVEIFGPSDLVWWHIPGSDNDQMALITKAPIRIYSNFEKTEFIDLPEYEL